ncbi:methylmalonyl-CoA epimerase [Halorutilales archaeon Cl-col2-1]|nr:methylmalonyl-CoA epimerase [Halobacteria archaeon]
MSVEFDHVGIAVEDADEALKTYRDVIGMEFDYEEEFGGMRVIFLEAGEGEFELLEPLDDDGAVARHLEKRGEGIQHVAVKVDSIEDELERLEDLGIRLIDDEPRPGAGGKQVAFLHPGDTHGVLLELCEY